MQNDTVKGLEQTIDLFNDSAIVEIFEILSHDLEEIKSRLSSDAEDTVERLSDLEATHQMIEIVKTRLRH